MMKCPHCSFQPTNMNDFCSEHSSPLKKRRTLRNQRIRAKVRMAGEKPKVELGGWLEGKGSYIRIGEAGTGPISNCLGWIEGYQLYRLAKAIVRRYENAR